MYMCSAKRICRSYGQSSKKWQKMHPFVKVSFFFKIEFNQYVWFKGLQLHAISYCCRRLIQILIVCHLNLDNTFFLSTRLAMCEAVGYNQGIFIKHCLTWNRWYRNKVHDTSQNKKRIHNYWVVLFLINLKYLLQIESVQFVLSIAWYILVRFIYRIILIYTTHNRRIIPSSYRL